MQGIRHFDGVSSLENRGTSVEVQLPFDRLQAFRNGAPDFDKAFRFPTQASVSDTKNLRSLQSGECLNVYWGKKELVSRLTGKWKSALYPNCHETWFTYTAWSRTKTWRECARAVGDSYQFFSWVKRHENPDGECILVKPSRSDISRTNMEDCLVDASGVKPGVNFCPGGGKEGTAEDWRDCAERCLRKFRDTNGDTENDLTFYKAECFRYSFNNATSACIFDPLPGCPDSASVNDLSWISGDVLSMPSANFTTVTWHDWEEWSSCDEVDAAFGWKKRTRRLKTWGYRPDNIISPSQWISVGPCAPSTTLPQTELDMAMNPSESSSSSTVTYAVGGGIGLVVIIVLGLIGRKVSQALPTEQSHDTYL
ncbi:conserved hypothetical protein [Neospora caninum Liverpool]|uniref:Microneme protein MIC16 n=1 Tax=Neospora caninum (strain Liverpool) TaxID=572307 RepID=F0VBX9_NEOCL|nr:conserved hypothetical protein [Neospora caninum Liverpool]CBZ51113.1 conserved hypothetical protein [Neospora caninum Liverpool]|eukprot:XP_003881146.1 conserved hypothetical protein [Neospora caninum Liverpool]